MWSQLQGVTRAVIACQPVPADVRVATAQQSRSRTLLGGVEATPSLIGIGLAIASLIIMPFLSWAHRRTGKALGSGTVVADSTQTLLCTHLSAVLLVGLVLNATLGWDLDRPDCRAHHRRRGQVRARGVARRGLQRRPGFAGR